MHAFEYVPCSMHAFEYVCAWIYGPTDTTDE
jgi:hypothetical protein